MNHQDQDHQDQDHQDHRTIKTKTIGPSDHQKKITRNTPIKKNPAPYNSCTCSVRPYSF